MLVILKLKFKLNSAERIDLIYCKLRSVLYCLSVNSCTTCLLYTSDAADDIN